MPVIAAAEEAGATRRRAESNGATFWHTSYIGANRYRDDGTTPPPAGTLYPMAFLVEQDPGCTVGAHFHQADQFQVMVGGEGRLGTHDVGPVAVHFVAAFSAYGPIRASGAGLHYFTLRNGWDPGARYMPGARAELPRPRRHREAVSAPVPLHDPATRRSTVPRVEPLIAPEPDGLAAWRHVLPPGTALLGPQPRGGAGQYWIVLAGSLLRDGARLGSRSCLFVAPDEPPLRADAGDDGLEILALQFPLHASV